MLLIKFLKHIHNDVGLKVSNFKFIILNRFNISREHIKKQNLDMVLEVEY